MQQAWSECDPRETKDKLSEKVLAIYDALTPPTATELASGSRPEIEFWSKGRIAFFGLRILWQLLAQL